MRKVCLYYSFNTITSTSINYRIKPTLIDESGSCTNAINFIVQLNYTLKDSDFKAEYLYSNLMTANIVHDGENQMFTFDFSYIKPSNTDYQNVTFNITRPFDPTFPFPNGYSFPVGEFICRNFSSAQFQIVKVGKPLATSSGLQTQIIQFNFDPLFYQQIPLNFLRCSILSFDSYFNCTIAKPKSGKLSQYILVLFLYPGYTSIPSNVTVRINVYGMTIYQSIDIKFPIDVYRSTKYLYTESYPNSGVTIQRDYQYIDYNFIIFNYFQNFNSILLPNIYTPHPFPVFRNETHIVFANENTYYNSTGLYATYLCDSTSDIVYENYSSTLIGLFFEDNSIFSDYIDNETNTVFFIANLNYQSVLNIYLSIEVDTLRYSVSNFYPYVLDYTNNPPRFNYTFLLPFSDGPNSKQIYAKISPYSIAKSYNLPKGPTAPAQYISVVESFEMRNLTGNSVVIRMRVRSNFQIMYFSFAPLPDIINVDNRNLVDGNEFNGTYEFQCNFVIPDYLFAFVTTNFNYFRYYSGITYNMNGDTLPSLPVIQLNIESLTYFKFSQNNITLDGGDNILELNISLADDIIDMIDSVKFTLPTHKKTFVALYDQKLNLYVFNIKLPIDLNYGTLEYYLSINNINFEYFNIFDKYGDSALLFVSKTYNKIGFFKPIVTEVILLNSNLVIDQNEQITVGWSIRIVESYIGISNGTVSVISDRDYLPRVISFNESNLIEGDRFNGLYNISFVLKVNCVSQTFKIANISLFDYDQELNRADYLLYSTLIQSKELPIKYDYLSFIYGSTTYKNQLNVQLLCNSNSGDINPPSISSFTFSSSVDVGTLDRTVEFNLTTFELSTESGVSLRHHPVIHLNSENTNHIQLTTNIVNISGDFVNYNVKVQLPFAFGMNYIFVSVFGIVDNNLNYKAYNSLELKNLNFKYYIKREFSLITPIIEHSSELTNRGGSLTIYGKSFGLNNDNMASYIDYGNGYETIELTFHSGIILQFKNRIKPINSNFIKFKVIRNSISSNEFIIPVIQLPPLSTPTPTPTSAPVKCPGTPSCNNNGQCINSICQCNQPWYGPSCSSKTIIVPIPPAYPEPATGTNVTTSGSLITTSIEIIGIRELDDINNIVEQFNISTWNFTDQTTPTTNPKYFYSTQINQRSTILNVTIEYFKQSTNITFANQNLFIPQSTIKFTMNLNSYRFKQPTNTLQILMKATIESDQSDVCSSSGFGSVNGSIQWIKLNVGDQSLYGRFLSDGMIDNTVTPIKNVIIDQDDIDSEQNKQFRSAIVGITIPSYSDFVDLDPDFSNLIDVGSSDTSDFICADKKGLSTGAIAGIVVGGVVFIAILVGGILFAKRYHKFRKQDLKLKKRITKIDQLSN
ncbi:EGF-like domain-containing protein [Heterostelium album PN500]|uniref:EGF-like domain-containing protein n=1 Tax=Heterostelium pallidum (strain ATCC 26659 / Pp 5 / PN500) TaxID=670386 RepID=D3BT57_HETP5|nr:EGF-like domain-containing protein [Heterostelium album PN500]EFA75274.1 EGF-like domain-containing protein [Heterostelium album PN500]|eukprot:XP_020427408.1 EGF-like domain-containing protein [Heterostelium album PN500]